jgi:hypothetical protein
LLAITHNPRSDGGEQQTFEYMLSDLLVQSCSYARQYAPAYQFEDALKSVKHDSDQ